MMNINGDVFVGVLTRSYEVDKGFKGLLKLPDEQVIGVAINYDGKLKEYLTNMIGKTVLLVGNLSFPKNKLPFVTVRRTLNGGGSISKRGRLTRDPELKYSTDGKQYTLFSIAVNRGFGDRQQTDFINCTIFGNQYEKNPAVSFAESAKKGQEVIVEGRLSTNKGKDKTFYNLIVTEYEYIFSNRANSKDSQEETDPYSEFADLGAEISLNDLGDVEIINDTEEIPF